MMELKYFKVNDLIRITICGCTTGIARILTASKDTLHCQWIISTDAHPCMSREKFVDIRQWDIDNNMIEELELIERCSEETKRLYITDDSVKAIVDLYDDNKEELLLIEQKLTDNGVLDDGTENVYDTFEQGYNNALEQVMRILDIPFAEEEN